MRGEDGHIVEEGSVEVPETLERASDQLFGRSLA